MMTCQQDSFREELTMTAVKIGIIIGSTRPGRVGDQVAKWVLEQASARTDAEFELVDLADFALPHLDEAVPPSLGQYAQAHTKAWAEKVDSFDGYIFVTPEYNHSTSGALKNALDFVYGEWNDKAAGLVSYGAAGGTRAAEHLRLILGELQVADVRQQVAFSLMTDFENYRVFTPAAYHQGMLATQLDQLVPWAAALKGVRDARSALAAAASPEAASHARTPPHPPSRAPGAFVIGSGRLVRQAVGVVDTGPHANGWRGALERGVVDALRPLAGAHVREHLVESALRAERDERGAFRVPDRAADGHRGGVAVGVVVVRASEHRTLGNGGQFVERHAHGDLQGRLRRCDTAMVARTRRTAQCSTPSFPLVRPYFLVRLA
jgi:NAD(P)H-dependent FMN reductase